MCPCISAKVSVGVSPNETEIYRSAYFSLLRLVRTIKIFFTAKLRMTDKKETSTSLTFIQIRTKCGGTASDNPECSDGESSSDQVLSFLKYFSEGGDEKDVEKLTFDVNTGKLTVKKSPLKTDQEQDNSNPVMTNMAASGYF